MKKLFLKIKEAAAHAVKTVKKVFASSDEPKPPTQKAAPVAQPRIAPVRLKASQVAHIALSGVRPEGMDYQTYKELMKSGQRHLKRARKGVLLWVSSVLIPKKTVDGQPPYLVHKSGSKTMLFDQKTKGNTYVKAKHGSLVSAS